MDTTKRKALQGAALVLLAAKGIQTLMRNRKERKASRPDIINKDEPSVRPQIDAVTEASMESFPASDAPSFSPGHA